MSNTIYAQYRTQDLIKHIILYRDMTFPKLSGFILFFPKLPDLEIAVLKFHDLFQVFHDRMNPECDDYLNRTKL